MIFGIAASLSMAASEYLHEEEEKKSKPRKYAMYTGFAYFITVLFLISPYLFISNVYTSAIVMLIFAIIIIAIYSYYISNIQALPFKSRFLKMTLISLGVAAISFAIGSLIRIYLGIEV